MVLMHCIINKAYFCSTQLSKLFQIESYAIDTTKSGEPTYEDGSMH